MQRHVFVVTWALLILTSARAFCVQTKRLSSVVSSSNGPASRLLASSLYAKKKKKVRSSSAGGGGFGKNSKTKDLTSATTDDYAIFPALEPRILETLVPAPIDWQQETGPLPGEILDRLDQIYGFSNFNGQGEKEASKQEPEPKLAADQPLSLNDLLSVQQPE